MSARGGRQPRGGGAQGGRRRIAVVTGTRAEYGLLTSTLEAIAADPGLELQLIVTGMHLLPAFGSTWREIARAGYPIGARVPMQRGDDGRIDQAGGLARGVAGIAGALERLQADVVLVLGDRIEALAGALAAVTTGRFVAHIHGGDVAPGDFDESVRHAITKLAHFHFAATRAAARRIVRMGEARGRVFVVGAPGLDRLRELTEREAPTEPEAPARVGGKTSKRRNVETSKRPTEPEAPARARGKPPAPTALVVYHACGRSAAYEGRVMRTILETVRAAGLRRQIIFPNTDRGHSGVVAAIEAHGRASAAGEVDVHRSLERDAYLRALLRGRVLIGNSSSGIIEAPLAGTPSVNVGPRQAGREPGGRTVISCGEEREAIGRALRRALGMRARRGGRSVYGDGRAGWRIARLLVDLPIDERVRRKRLAY